MMVSGSYIVPNSVGVIEDAGGCRGDPIDMWPDKPLTQLEGGGV